MNRNRTTYHVSRLVACRRSWMPSLALFCITITTGNSLIVMAQDDLADRFEKQIYENADKQTLQYRFLKPATLKEDQKYPLVVFLHGAGERGTDNTAQLVHGVQIFATDEFLEKYPCFVIAPQAPSDTKWVDVDWASESSTMPAEPTVPMRLTIELIDKLSGEFPIDPARIYITGLSMGGYGAWDAIQRYPDRFAAAVPVCGGGDPAQLKPCVDIPVWAFHGAKDQAVKVNRSREMIDALKALGGKPRYTEYPEVGHNCWVPAYKTLEMYEWLFMQRKNDDGQ